jgi:hypothetical protein
MQIVLNLLFTILYRFFFLHKDANSIFLFFTPKSPRGDFAFFPVLSPPAGGVGGLGGDLNFLRKLPH